MCFAEGHNELNAVRPKLESLGLESSALSLSHCASIFSLQLSIYIWLAVLPYVPNKKRKLTLNVLLQIYMYTYAFIIHVTEYERLKIKIPVEGSFELYLHFIPPLCLIIWFLNLILVNYSPQYDDLQNPWFNFPQNPWLNYADSYHNLRCWQPNIKIHWPKMKTLHSIQKYIFW